MSAASLRQELEEARATIRALHEELEETNRGLAALAFELEEARGRADRRTAPK